MSRTPLLRRWNFIVLLGSEGKARKGEKKNHLRSKGPTLGLADKGRAMGSKKAWLRINRKEKGDSEKKNHPEKDKRFLAPPLHAVHEIARKQDGPITKLLERHRKAPEEKKVQKGTCLGGRDRRESPFKQLTSSNSQ